MKNIQCLPQVYLVPKKFHCGVTPTTTTTTTTTYQQESQEYTATDNIVSKENCNPLVKSRNDWGDVKSNDDNAYETVGSNIGNMMYKRYLNSIDAGQKSRNKDRLFTQDKLSQSFHIVCKATQSERITQFQLITSNKLENILNNKETDTKWCPVDFYERPKQPFKYHDAVGIIFKDPTLLTTITESVIDANNKKLEKPFNIAAVNISYEVTSVDERSVHLSSTIDLSVKRTFAPLLICPENDETWEQVFKLVESQLGETFKKMIVQIGCLKKK